MTVRPRRAVTVFGLALSVFFFLAIRVLGQTQPTQWTIEPRGPEPSVEVQKLLNEASRLADNKQPADSLKVADHALDAAERSGDKPGEAFSHQSRARALQELKRTDEALAAWQSAAQIWADTGNSPEQIMPLVQAGLLCVVEKRTEAEKFFVKGMSLAKLEIPRSSSLAQALQDAGTVLYKHEQKSDGLNYLAAALALREKRTPESPDLVELLNTLTNISIDLAIDGNDEKYYSMSKDYAVRAVEIAKRVAPESSGLVEGLHLLCFVEKSLDTQDSAREHCLEALRIQKKLAPGGSMMEAKILNTIGRLEVLATHFDLAHTYFNEGLAMSEKLAPESETYQHILLFLSTLETNEGNLQDARELLLRLLAMQEKQHQWTAPTYINLGSVALGQNDFASAREYSEKALDILLKTKPNNVGVQYALGNLGLVAYRQGDFATALKYGRRVIEIDQHRPDGLDTADDYDQLGDVFLHKGDLASAADYYQRALHVREHIAPESLHVSYSLTNLSRVARAQGNRALALEYDDRALAMGKKSCANSWCVAEILHDLGDLTYELGDLARSESHLRQAVDLRKESLGLTHPDLARSLNQLALTLAAERKTTEALADALRAESIGAEHLRVSARTLSERQALAYEDIRASGLDLALTLVGDRASNPSAKREVFDAVIRSRALVFDELAARRRSVYDSGNPELKQLAEDLFSARARLATLAFRGVGDSSPEEYRKLLDDARGQKENVERLLAEKSAVFRQDQLRAQADVNDLSASLPAGTALLAYVRYDRYVFRGLMSSRRPTVLVPSYGVFVLRARGHEPDFVRLGSAREIEGVLQSWRRTIAQEAEAADRSQDAIEDACRRKGAALRREIWDPLASLVGDAREVLIVPDAALHLVNLGALPVGRAQYLIETGPVMHYLSTERDLLATPTRHGDGLLVVGNPAFDRVGNLIAASNQTPPSAKTTPDSTATLLGGSRSACGSFHTLHFPPLPASRLEAENIAALWRKFTSGEGTENMRSGSSRQTSGELQQLIGAEASAETFEQNAPGKRVLHVATHGFFLEGNCESVVQRKLHTDDRDELFLPATAESPLLLSGLAFAGANRRNSAKPGETDGILTAEEIAGINLEGVDWAVLSACDTGIGEIKLGEGVFGLRRAFQLAGAKTVIMSLWPVEDQTSREWMETLYQEHFLNGKDTRESVRSASLQILKQRRSKHQSTHPLYWGPFIAVGDWH